MAACQFLAGAVAGCLTGWCRRRLANYKVPRIVEFWEEIPKLPNGKIDKRAVLATPARGSGG